jgi:AI-2 transport protein TqsA
MEPVLREQRLQTVCLLILSVIAIAIALVWLRPVMIPFVLASVFAIGLSPLIDLQTRYLRFPRPLAVLATLVIGVVLLSLIGAIISISVRELTSNVERYQAQIQVLLRQATALLSYAGISADTVSNALVQVPIQTVSGMLMGTTNAVLGILSQGLLMLIFLVFLLLGGTTRGTSAGGMLGVVEARIRRYILTKVLLSALTGLLVGAVLMILGVDLALAFGLLAFLLNFVPSVGSIVATLLPLPVVLVSPDISMSTAILAVAIPAGIQLVLGNIVEPKIMGGSLDLHPVTILLALILWGMLWGIIGMLLATPLTAIMKIIFERIELTAPVAELLAGRLDALRAE